MKTALISDIHGNAIALMKVLQDIEYHGVNRIVCLGDIVEGGNGNNEACELLQKHNVICVRGNHDEEHDAFVHPQYEKWLTNLPIDVVENNTIFVHESPANPPRKIKDNYEPWRVFDETSYKRIFVGDSHISAIYTDKGMSTGHAQSISFEYEHQIHLDTDARYIVCPGAVGYSRDQVNKPKFAIFDSDLDTITFFTSNAPTLNL